MENKPLISFILITYNQENFVRDALDGAFAQTYSPMEIIIADDGSKDDTPKVIEEYIAGYNGPHKVVFHHNEKNVGIAQNVNNAMALAKGEYFILAAGDDKSMPRRAQRTYELFSKYPDMVSLNFTPVLSDANLKPIRGLNEIDEKHSLSLINIFDYCEFSNFILWSGDTRSIHRSLYDTFGSLTKGRDEDSTYFLRGLLLGKVGHSQEQLSYRRVHDMQVSKSKNIKKHIPEDFLGQPMLDIQKAVSLGIISQKAANLFLYKIRCADRIFADRYYEDTNFWYRFAYSRPVNLLRRLKNVLFK